MNIEGHYFQEKAERAKRTLAKMKVDLEEYAARDNANPKAISIRQEVIDNLYDFIQCAEETMGTLQDEVDRSNVEQMVKLQEAYDLGANHAYRKGYDTSEKQYTVTRENGKEAYRHDTIRRIKETFPNLF